MSNVDPTVVDLLTQADNKHSQKLLHYLVDDQIPVDRLDYEDVFYPLQAHSDAGLCLRLIDDPGVAAFVWGPGDFIFWADETNQTPENAVDPFRIWETIQTSESVTVDVTILPDDWPEADA